MTSIPTPEQLEHFARNGYVALDAVVDDRSIAALREAFETLEGQWAEELGVSVARYRAVVSQWTGLWERHPAFAAQIHHPAVEQIARALLGVERLQLFHDHLISKPAEQSDTVPWHQDYPFWPVDKPRALSCWLSLDEVGADAGALHFMPGAHLEGEQPPVDFLARNKVWGTRQREAVAVPTRPGSVIFHSCLSWHFSPPNRSRSSRRAFIAIYMDSDCRWDPSHSEWHPMNAAVSVPPGARFNTDRFPLIRRSDRGEVTP